MVLAIASAIALLASCGYHGEEAGPPAALHALPSVAALKTQFNQDAGSTRLLLLFSPT